MPMDRSFLIMTGFLTLILALGRPQPTASAQVITPHTDSFVQQQWSNLLHTGVGVRVSDGVKGLAYLFRPTNKPTRNLWERRQHPELWRSTAEEWEAGKAALPLVGGLTILGLLAWGGRRLYRTRRSTATTSSRDRPDRRTPVTLATSR